MSDSNFGINFNPNEKDDLLNFPSLDFEKYTGGDQNVNFTWLTFSVVNGTPTMYFRGIPIPLTVDVNVGDNWGMLH